MLQTVRRSAGAAPRRLIRYDRDMTELRPCSGCRRHIDASERVCPFCGVFGRLSRAAAIAGLTLATATASACGGTKPKTEPPPLDNQQQQSTTTVDAGVESVPTPDDPEEDRHRHHRGNNGNAKMPYGAPPRARRIV